MELEPLRVRLPSTTFSGFPSSASSEAARAGGREFWTTGHHVIAWIERHCVLTAAHYIGRPFRLLSWQKQLLLELFEVAPNLAYGAPDEPRWLRRYRWALIGIPKKNGKTELVAALGLYFLVADDEPAPLVVCAAASDNQADLVFGAASTMVRMSPTLSQVCQPFASQIEVHGKPGAILKRVAAVSGTNDGPNIYVALLDELHEWTGKKGEGTWNVLTQGGGARRQPMVIQITTAGSDEETKCYSQYEYGVRVRDGSTDDHAFYFYWIEPEREDVDHRLEETWAAVNPSWGLILRPEFYRDQLTKKTEAVFRRYFLNQWTEADEIWEAAGLWDGLVGAVHLEEDLPLFVGIDVGRRSDSTAVVACQWHDDEARLHVAQTIWVNPYPRDDPRHRLWKLNTVKVEDLLRTYRVDFPVPAMDDEDEGPQDGPAFLYDPHFFNRSADMLSAEGLNMVETPQTDSRMVPASQRLFEIIKGGMLVHDGDAEARRQIRSVVAKEKERGWRIARPLGSRKHIDFAVALAMAAFEATRGGVVDEDVPEVW